MISYRIILSILLVLIGFSLIFSTPGSGTFENYHNYLINHRDDKTNNTLNTIILFSPGQSSIYNLISQAFPIDPNIKLFSSQPAWSVSKLINYLFYLLTFFAIIVTFRNRPKLDLSIAFFGSLAIALISISLGFPEIFGAPFFILAITYLSTGQAIKSTLFFVAAVFFNWTLILLSPLFLITSLRLNSQTKINKPILVTTLAIFPISMAIFYFITTALNGTFLSYNGNYSISITTLLTRQLAFILNKSHTNSFIDYLSLGLSAVMFLYITTSLIYQLLKFFSLKKIFAPAISLIISISILLLPLMGIYLNLIIYGVLIAIYIIIIWTFIKTPKVTISGLLIACFGLIASAIALLPNISIGNMLWLLIISLLLYLNSPSPFYQTLLYLTNVTTFIVVFSIFGASGHRNTGDIYSKLFIEIFSYLFIAFAIWFCSSSTSLQLLSNLTKATLTRLTRWMHIFLIAILALAIVSLIPAEGSSDHVSWTQYSMAAVNTVNPFHAYTQVILQYPPLSIAIMGFFANIWKTLIGTSQDYTIATKLSILVFYLFSMVSLYFYRSKLNNLSKTYVAVTLLTTFSLIVQTLGLADINIYVIPSLFASFVLLFRKNYFMSGLFMGLTLSIKWQPTILLPLFAATIINFQNNFKASLVNAFQFLVGLSLIPLLVWGLVLIQPDGPKVTVRAFNFIAEGASMLSGQALNLNWIVTYFMHIYQPESFESIEYLGGLNRQVGSISAPLIFQGFFFLIASIIILTRFWLFQPKNLVTFLSASIIIFFSHHILNKSAYEKHLFYTVILMLFLYLVRPTDSNKKLLILFDIMTVMNLIFFYGFTGPKDINRLIFGFDITVLFSAYYVLIYFWVLYRYLKKGGLLFSQTNSE